MVLWGADPRRAERRTHVLQGADYIATRPEIDAKRVVGQGGSWSGYYAAKPGILEKARLDDFLAFGPKMSLKEQGLIGKPSAPMLLVNGDRDAQVPIADLCCTPVRPRKPGSIPVAGTWGARPIGRA